MALYLVDTSAWSRGTATTRWRTLLSEAEIAICPPIALELLDSARGPSDYRSLALHLSRLPGLPLDERAVTRAQSTQAELAVHSQHRGPTPVDLLVAAVAEVNGAVLLHYDRHFDAIAGVTGQPMEWLARRGSLD